MDLLFKAGLVIVLGAAVLIGIVAGRSQPPFVSSAAPLPTATAIAAPPPGEVDIVPNPSGQPPDVYRPSTLVVRVGDTVTWFNRSGTDESVTADNGAFGSDVLGTGQPYQWKATKAGTYSYGSYLDPDLRGTIQVVK